MSVLNRPWRCLGPPGSRFGWSCHSRRAVEPKSQRPPTGRQPDGSRAIPMIVNLTPSKTDLVKSS